MDEITKTGELAKLARSLGVRELDLLAKIPANVPVKIEGTDLYLDWQELTDIYDDSLVEALSYCNRDEALKGMLTSVRDLAKIRYNIKGSEGETSRSEGGVSQSFEEGIPKRIKSSLNRYRVARMRSML